VKLRFSFESQSKKTAKKSHGADFCHSRALGKSTKSDENCFSLLFAQKTESRWQAIRIMLKIRKKSKMKVVVLMFCLAGLAKTCKRDFSEK